MSVEERIDYLLTEVGRYAEQVRKSEHPEGRYSAAWELKLVASELESAVPMS